MIGENGDFYQFMMERAGLVPVGTYPYNRPINGVDACAFVSDNGTILFTDWTRPEISGGVSLATSKFHRYLR